MKTLVTILCLVALNSCNGVLFSVQTPYGEVNSDKTGRFTIIVTPEK